MGSVDVETIETIWNGAKVVWNVLEFVVPLVLRFI